MEGVVRFVKPAISVIMLTYNRENLVSRAIESVARQTFADYEFIVVNNGSTDRSGIIADEYAKKDPRMRVIHRSKGNIGSGRNAGLDAAAGEYIAFIDDDDWCEPDFLEFLYSLAIDNCAGTSICGANGKAFDEKVVMNAEEAVIELLQRRRFNAGFPTKMFRRDIALCLRFSENGDYDDISHMYRLLALSKRVVYHGLPKYTICRHDNNNSGWTTNHSLLTSKILDEYLEAYRMRTAWLSGIFPNRTAAFRYFELSFMVSMVEKINRLELTDCMSQLDAMTRGLTENQDEFLSCKWITELEKEWMKKYVCSK